MIVEVAPGCALTTGACRNSWRRLTAFLRGSGAPTIDAADLNTVQDVEFATRKMLDTPTETNKPVEKFYRWWLQLNRLKAINSGVSDVVRAAMDDEPVRFGANTTYAHGTFTDLLVTNPVSVPIALADIYGNRMDRGGLLTLPGILAAGATPTRTSPTKRGIFIRDQLLCESIPPPPVNEPVVPPQIQWQGRTLRQELETLQDNQTCKTCHSLVDTLGFAYERFDRVGRWRNSDNGQPIDDSGLLDGQPVNGPQAMGMILAGSRQAQRCFSQRWLEFAMSEMQGRPLIEGASPTVDPSAVDDVEKWAVGHQFEIREIIVGVTRSSAFLAP